MIPGIRDQGTELTFRQLQVTTLKKLRPPLLVAFFSQLAKKSWLPTVDNLRNFFTDANDGKARLAYRAQLGKPSNHTV